MKDKYNKYNRYMTLGFGLSFLSIPLCIFLRYFLILSLICVIHIFKFMIKYIYMYVYIALWPSGKAVDSDSIMR